MRKLTLLLLLPLALFAFNLQAQQGEKEQTKKIEIESPSKEKEVVLPKVLQEELKRADEEGDSKFYQEFLKMLFSLAILIGALVASMWFFKRVFLTKIQQGNESSGIKILERRSLSPKSTIFILNVLGKSMVIAESANGVTVLTEAGERELGGIGISGRSNALFEKKPDAEKER